MRAVFRSANTAPCANISIAKSGGLADTARTVAGAQVPAGIPMSFHHKLLGSALALLTLLLSPVTTRAQSFGLAASVSPNPVQVSNTVVYTLFTTNIGSVLQGDIIYLTNAIPASWEFMGVTNIADNLTYDFVEETAARVVVRIDSAMTNGAVSQLTWGFRFFSVGSVTNTFTVAAPDTSLTNATTNLVLQVTAPTADLTIGLTNMASGVYSNDLTTVGLFVTNLGPSTATGVLVSNQWPASFVITNASPSSASYANYGGTNLVWTVGTLTNGARQQLLLTVIPTNRGTFNLSATVSGSVNDINATNNSIVRSMIVETNPVPALRVTNISAQVFNPQTSWMQQSVTVVNEGTNNVPAFRLLVSGLTGTNRLVTTIGTNSAQPFVLHNAPLATNQSVGLLLEYYVPSRTPLTNLTFDAIAVNKANLNAPTNLANLGSDTAFVVTQHRLASGAVLIEFPAVTNASYTIIYSDDGPFTEAVVSQPSVTSVANRKQWIDNGPPRTVSHPTNTPARFYRVLRTQ
jgi:hypothetical protein